MARSYHDFVIYADNVHKNAAGQVSDFTVRVLSSPVGEGEKKEHVTIPDYSALRIQMKGLATGISIEKQMAFGKMLGDMILPAHARDMFFRSLDWIKQYDDMGLRIRLRLPTELSWYPWEFMLVQQHYGEMTLPDFILLNPKISIVRHEQLAIPAPWFAPGEKRRVLIAMSTVGGKVLKHLPEEQRLIKQALRDTNVVDPIYLPQNLSTYDESATSLPSASLEDVADSLDTGVDIFHFSGHGSFPKQLSHIFDTYKGAGGIYLAGDDDTSTVSLSASDLLEQIRGHGVRLVLLGACETATADAILTWNSVARTLLKGDVSAVVAMQFPVDDELAAAFMGEVYEALATGCTIDEAVSKGRQAIRRKTKMASPAADQDSNCRFKDWGTPVLHLRASGHIFPPISDKKALVEIESRLQSQSLVHSSMYLASAHLLQSVNGKPLRTEVPLLSEKDLRTLEAQETLKLEPVELVHVLHSAVAADTDECIWVEQLDSKRGSDYIQQLDIPATDIKASDAEVLGSMGIGASPLKENTASQGVLTWTAAHHDSSAVRRTVTLALSVIEPAPEAGIKRLEEALGSVKDGRTRNRIRAEQRGTLADVYGNTEPVRAGLSMGGRMGMWFWRFRRRLVRERQRIFFNTLCGALGAALALGLWRAVLNVLLKQTWLTEFFVRSYMGGLFGLLTVFGVSIAKSTFMSRQHEGIPKRVLLLRGVLVGLVFYFFVHMTIFMANSRNLQNMQQYFSQVITGTALGIGYTYFLSSHNLSPKRTRLINYVLAFFVTVLIAYLAQSILRSLSLRYATSAISMPSDNYDRILARDFTDMYAWLVTIPGWEHSVMLFDTIITYITLSIGTLLGLGTVQRMQKWWQTVVNH